MSVGGVQVRYNTLLGRDLQPVGFVFWESNGYQGDQTTIPNPSNGLGFGVGSARQHLDRTGRRCRGRARLQKPAATGGRFDAALRFEEHHGWLPAQRVWAHWQVGAFAQSYTHRKANGAAQVPLP